MNRVLTLSLALLSPLVLSRCANESAPKGSYSERIHGLTGTMKADTTLTASPLLKMTAPRLQKVWGTPKIKISANGSYVLEYEDPESSLEQLQIHAYPAGVPTPPIPPPQSTNAQSAARSWKTVELQFKGKQHLVKWFATTTGGATSSPSYSTEVFPITTGGQTTYFRLVIESNSGAAPGRFTEARLAL